MGRPKKRRRDGEADGPAQHPGKNDAGPNGSLSGLLVNHPQLDYGLTALHEQPQSNGSSHTTDSGIAVSMHDSRNITPNFDDTPTNDFGFNLDFTIDPSLWNLPPPTPQPPENNPCTCLSTTYLTLSTLQTLPTFSFPQVIPPLRTAMSALATLIHCPTCPLDAFTATQNVQSITSLFKALTARYAKALLDINAEATRLALTNTKKRFRVGDTNPALAHLHTGTADCPLGFNIDLEAREWKKIAKTALKMEVWGGGSGAVCLVGLLEECEERQRVWHGDKATWGEEMRHLRRGGECGEGKACEALGAEHIRRGIEGMDWE